MNNEIQLISDCESSMDTVASELLGFAEPKTADLYYLFRDSLQEDLRAKFGNVFENFPEPKK